MNGALRPTAADAVTDKETEGGGMGNTSTARSITWSPAEEGEFERTWSVRSWENDGTLSDLGNGERDRLERNERLSTFGSE